MSSVKQIINECNLGICCEEAALESDFILLKQYLKAIINEKKTKGTVVCNYDESMISQYNYCNISNQFEKTIDLLTGE